MKKTFLVIVLLALAAAGIVTYQHFTSSELKISDTPNVVTEMRKISEFTTATYCQERVLIAHKTSEIGRNKVVGVVVDIFHAKESVTDRLVLIVKGKVRAGFNLAMLPDSSIVAHGDTVDVLLPCPEILSVTINPSGYEFFAQDGKWTDEQINKVKKSAEAYIRQDAVRSGILRLAEQQGVTRITSMMKALGFNTVNVRIAP